VERRVFVSYSSHDREIATSVCRHLEAEGFACWMAPRDIAPGSNYGEAIINAIEECRAFVLIWSRSANASPQIQREVERAASKNRLLLPLRIENIQPSKALEYYLASVQWLDAISVPPEQYLADLASVLRKPPEQPAPIDHPRGVRRGTRVLLWSLLASAAFLGSVWLYVYLRSHPATPVNSLAIVPLANANPDPTATYLSRGITEDLINRVKRLPYLRVLPFSAVARFEGMPVNLDVLGRDLNIQAIVTGSLLDQGEQVTLRLETIRIEDGKVIWEHQYYTTFSSVPSVLDDVTREIAASLDIPSSPPVAQHLSNFVPANGEAYRLYLQGIFHAKKVNRDDNALSIELFTRAVDLDSTYLPALVALAESQVIDYEQGWNESRSILDEAERNCRSGLAIDSTYAEGVSVLGAIALARGRNEEAMALLTAACRLDPGNKLALTRLGDYYLSRNPAQAVTYLGDANRLDPTDADVLSNLGVGYGFMKDYPKALQAFQAALDIRPDECDYLTNLGYLYERLGKDDSARQAYTRALEKDSRNEAAYNNLATFLLAWQQYAAAESVLAIGTRLLPGNYRLIYQLGLAYALGGKTADARRTFLQGVSLTQQARESGVPEPYAYLALMYARLGERIKCDSAVSRALRLGSRKPEIQILASQAYAILLDRDRTMRHFKLARELSSEYDVDYLSTAVDFGEFRHDPDLISIASR
jgi:tetratricopeptide (TPR) repeat protein/TolB-like protein